MMKAHCWWAYALNFSPPTGTLWRFAFHFLITVQNFSFPAFLISVTETSSCSTSSTPTTSDTPLDWSVYSHLYPLLYLFWLQLREAHYSSFSLTASLPDLAPFMPLPPLSLSYHVFPHEADLLLQDDYYLASLQISFLLRHFCPASCNDFFND